MTAYHPESEGVQELKKRGVEVEVKKTTGMLHMDLVDGESKGHISMFMFDIPISILDTGILGMVVVDGESGHMGHASSIMSDSGMYYMVDVD